MLDTSKSDYYVQCLDMVSKEKMCLSNVRHTYLTKKQYFEICLSSAEHGYVYYVNDKALSPKRYFEVFLVSVKKFPFSLKALNESKLTQKQYFELIKEAVKQNPEAIDFLRKEKLSAEEVNEIELLSKGVFKMTSEQANLQDKQAEALQAMYRKLSTDFVANKQKIDKEDLMLMRGFFVVFTLFLLAFLSGWTGFYN